MQADWAWCCNQIDRLGGFDFPPTTTAGLKELYLTLQQCARSDDHARRIVDEIIESPGGDDGIHRWPKPDQIRSIAWSLLSDAEKAIGCKACNGTGFHHATKTINGVQFDFSTPCSCRPAGPAPEKPKRKTSPAPVRDFMPAWEDR